MTNQSKWLISAYAIFFCGGVLVPLDYKLTAAEQLQAARAFEGGIADRRIPPVARDHAIAGFREHNVATLVLVTEAPASADLHGAYRWEEFRAQRRARIRAAPARRYGLHRLFLRHRRAAQGCVLTHENYLEQCVALDRAVSFLAGRALSEHPAHQPRHRFHGRIHRAVRMRRTVVHLRTLRPEFVRDAFTRYKITYMSLVPHGAEKSRARTAAKNSTRCLQQSASCSTR